MPTDDRRRLRQHYDAVEAAVAPWRARSYCWPHPSIPPLPAELRDLRCGATTRRGTPCQNRAIYKNGRCKLHGGLSTGPKSAEGRARSLANLAKRWPPRPLERV